MQPEKFTVYYILNVLYTCFKLPFPIFQSFPIDTTNLKTHPLLQNANTMLSSTCISNVCTIDQSDLWSYYFTLNHLHNNSIIFSLAKFNWVMLLTRIWVVTSLWTKPFWNPPPLQRKTSPPPQSQECQTFITQPSPTPHLLINNKHFRSCVTFNGVSTLQEKQHLAKEQSEY